MSNFATLVEMLRMWSKCKKFPELTKEWTFVSYRDAGEYGDSSCICGHKLRYEYLIQNKLTKVPLIVGSKCIQHFPKGNQVRTDLDEARRVVEREAKQKRAERKRKIANEWEEAFAEGRAETVPHDMWPHHLEVYYDYIMVFEMKDEFVRVMYHPTYHVPPTLSDSDDEI